MDWLRSSFRCPFRGIPAIREIVHRRAIVPCGMALIALVVFPALPWADSRVVIATADGVPLSTAQGTGFHDRVLREAFKRIGLTMEMVHLPAERALVNADEGTEDGVYVRVQGLDSVYKNLRIVPEKVTDYEFVAFGKRAEARIDNWESLKDYHVGIVTGWKILETNVLHYQSLIKVKNAAQLFQALYEDKVDLIVYNKLDGFGTLKELGLKGIFALDFPLATKEMFLYLHRKREHLIPQLVNALRAMKDDGTYARIKTSALAPYLPE